MKANELRIGNIISYKSIIDGKTQDVSVNIYHLADIGKTSPLFDIERAYAYSQIPLTEEWLLRFGFEHKQKYAIGAGSYSMWELSGFILIRRIGVEYYFPSLPFSPVLPYVHQLQNLYFALTGTELELKQKIK